MGTYGAGVLRFDYAGHGKPSMTCAARWRLMPMRWSQQPDAVYAGTLDRGLAIYNASSGRWSFFTAGLPSKNVTAVEARGGILYIGTDNGLVKVPEASIRDESSLDLVTRPVCFGEMQACWFRPTPNSPTLRSSRWMK